MLDFFANNPFVLFGLLCFCWPGLLPVAGAWYVARHFDISIIPRRRPGPDGGGGDDI